jgi:uncharacterized protein YaiE (UPF0345 family)
MTTDEETHEMSQFDNVTVVREANIYFDGKVSSRKVIFADGSHKTLGVMLPGDYSFDTKDRERMEILAGELQVLLPGGEWQTIEGGQHFDVPANSCFQLRITAVTDYCCSYFDT